MDTHLRKCPEVKVECPNTKAGCAHSNVARKDLQSHLAECTFFRCKNCILTKDGRLFVGCDQAGSRAQMKKPKMHGCKFIGCLGLQNSKKRKFVETIARQAVDAARGEFRVSLDRRGSQEPQAPPSINVSPAGTPRWDGRTMWTPVWSDADRDSGILQAIDDVHRYVHTYKNANIFLKR